MTAGSPIPLPSADAQPLDYLTLPRPATVPAPGIFGLRVRGDSMIDAHVNDGDVIVIKPQKSADNGDLIVARLHYDPTNLETTFKRYFRYGNSVTLRPENPDYALIVVRAKDVEIIGVVLDVWRNRARRKSNSGKVLRPEDLELKIG